MKAWTVCGMVLALLLGVGGPASAQVSPPREDWGYLGSIGSRYDPKTELSLSGTVVALNRVPLSRRRNCFSLVLELEEAGQVRSVYLGPTSYLKRKGFSFETGAKVSVTGSNVTVKGRPLIMARELKLGDRLLSIRDAQGRHL